MKFTRKDIEEMQRVDRLNLINSITGIKPANLIGSISKSEIENLAIFSSVVHLGSNPALLGFVLRPDLEVKRDTFNNILETGVYTINHIPSSHIERAHYTSAKFPASVSEFQRCGFQSEYLEDFAAPFVKESPLKIGLSLQEEVPIKLNSTRMIVGQIEHLIIERAFTKTGHLDLGEMGSVGISGLNSYYSLQKLAQFPYARVEETPEFKS